MITQKRLKEAFNYDSETGIFRWKIKVKGNVKPNDLAGCHTTKTNGRINIDGIQYSAAQMAWLYVYGIKPEKVWPINGNSKDLSIKNLTTEQPKIEDRPLTQKRVKEVLDYNPNTGIFTWKINMANRKAGTIAGTLPPKGKYYTISVDKKRYLNHRLAWFYVYGYFPENNIDHINRIKTDNRIENLREVSPSCNMRNMGLQKNNTSGIRGVYWYGRHKKWCAQIKVNKKTIPLGSYKCFIDAVKARVEAEDEVNWEACGSISPAKEYLLKAEKGEKDGG